MPGQRAAQEDANDIIDDVTLPPSSGAPKGSSLQWDSKLLFPLGISGVCGFVFMMMVNSILYMTATSPLFAWLMLLCLALMSGVMFLESALLCQSGTPLMVLVIRLGAAITIGASISCLFVRYARFGTFLDTVFLMQYAAGACYALCYAAVDMYNKGARQGSSFCGRQIYTIAAVTILSGCCAGFVFGLVDVEEHRQRLQFEQWLSGALGLVAGALVGLANHFAEDESLMITFDPLPAEEVEAPEPIST